MQKEVATSFGHYSQQEQGITQSVRYRIKSLNMLERQTNEFEKESLVTLPTNCWKGIENWPNQTFSTNFKQDISERPTLVHAVYTVNTLLQAMDTPVRDEHPSYASDVAAGFEPVNPVHVP